jgi:phosphate-selective porin OprO/OprP
MLAVMLLVSVPALEGAASGQADPAVAEPVAPLGPLSATAGQGGFSVQSPDGAFQLRIGLLVQTDGRFALGDGGAQVIDTFVVRRVRPSLRGRLARHFEFYLNPDVAGGTVVVQDAYIDTVFAPAFRVRVGKAKTPFGLERLHSAAHLLFFERALPTALAPNRDVGVQVLGEIAGGLLGYGAGVANGVPDGGSADVAVTDGKDFSGRVVVRPFQRLAASNPVRGLGFAVAGSTGEAFGAAALPSFRSQSLQQPFFSYSGASAAGRRTRYSPQVFYYHKAMGGFAEYVHTEVPIARGPFRQAIAHEAWQLAGSLVLTGEAATDGSVGVRPRADVDVHAGTWGALELALRYHRLQIAEAARTLGFAAPTASLKAEAWTLGLNWYLTPNVRYVLNVERTVFDDAPDGPRSAENALVFRSQVAF